MAELDLNNLRGWLDEQESFVRSIRPGDPRMDIARQMSEIIADAKSRFVPSTGLDVTIDFSPDKQFVEQLSELRSRAERMDRR